MLAAPPARSYASLAEFVDQGKGKLNVTRGVAYDAAIETQLARLAAAGRLEVVNDFETVFAKLEMGRADGTLATPPIYGKYLKSGKLHSSAVIVQLPEATPRFTGIYLAKSTISPAVRDRYAVALKAMVKDQTIRTIYARYVDEATLKRMIGQSQGPLLTALSAPE